MPLKYKPPRLVGEGVCVYYDYIIKLWLKLVGDGLEDRVNLVAQDGQNGDNDNGNQH
jgi:hypothetical protein